MEDSGSLFCSSKFPWARERISSKSINNLGSCPQNGSPAQLQWLHYRSDGRGIVDSRKGQEIFIFSETSTPALGPAQLHIQWVLEDLSRGGGGKRPECETDQSPPRNAKAKNTWNYTSIHPHTVVVCTGTTLPSFLQALCWSALKHWNQCFM